MKTKKKTFQKFDYAFCKFSEGNLGKDKILTILLR